MTAAIAERENVQAAEKNNAAQFTVDHNVPRQCRAAFLATCERLHEACRAWPGYRSVEMTELAPQGDVLRFRTVTAFDSQTDLISWVDSDVRRDLLHGAQAEFSYDYKLSAYDGWFPAADGTPPSIPAWKANLIVLLVLYPTVLALSLVLAPLTRLMNFSWGMLLSNFCSVAITGFWLIPYASKVYQGWLKDPVSARARLVAPLTIAALLVAFAGVATAFGM